MRNCPKLSGESLLARAFCYALMRTRKLRARLEQGFQELDKDTVKRFMRPLALGCENYLSMGSEGRD